jgi:hypothetical protein
VLASACVAPQPKKTPDPITTKPTICDTARKCEKAWVAAQNAIEVASGMRLRLVSDTRLETFHPTSIGRLRGTVTKYPVGESSYEIRAQFDCYGYTDCTDLRNPATNLFNIMVAGSLI